MILRPLSIALIASAASISANALTINTTAGELKNAVTSPATVKDLTVTGSMDASDYFFISREMTSLATLDLSNTTISSYNGLKINGRTAYEANTVPASAFVGSTVRSVILPSKGEIAIGDAAFAGSQLTSIALPSNIRTVGDGAFTGCPNLAKATVECPVLGTGAFAGCASLETVEITNPVEIGSRSFADCTSLSVLTGSDKVTLIGERAFADCPRLTTFTFGESLTEIGMQAFTASGLASVNLDECRRLASVGPWAFANMPDLTSVRMGTVREIGEGVVFDCPRLADFHASEGAVTIPAYAYAKDTGMDTTYMFPPTTAEIGAYALYGMTQISTLTLPESVEYIGDHAMKDMTALKSLTVSTSEVPALGEGVWDGVNQADAYLFVPKGAGPDYDSADQWKEFTVVEAVTGVDDAVVPEQVSSLRGRFVGHELQVSASGVEISRLSLYDTAGMLLASVEPMSDLVTIDTEGMAARIYIVSAILGDGRTATLKLAK